MSRWPTGPFDAGQRKIRAAARSCGLRLGFGRASAVEIILRHHAEHVLDAGKVRALCQFGAPLRLLTAAAGFGREALLGVGVHGEVLSHDRAMPVSAPGVKTHSDFG